MFCQVHVGNFGMQVLNVFNGMRNFKAWHRWLIQFRIEA